MERSDLYESFATRFHAGKRLRSGTMAQLDAAESEMGILWPESYRNFVMACGAVYCPSILDLIVENKAAYSDVQQFLTPSQSVTETRRWHLEPAGRCAAIASDCSGNWFAFRSLPTSLPRPDDAEVWLFDQENDEVVSEAASFDDWLGRFLTL